jgi:cytoskeleton protein RodZ
VAGIGSTLRNARVQHGLTIDQVAQDTRISARFLEALEADRFEELPAPVYVRGFLRSYANYLKLDPAPLVASLPDFGVATSGAAPTRPTLGREQPRQGSDPFRRAPAPPPEPVAPTIPGVALAEDDWESATEIETIEMPASPRGRPAAEASGYRRTAEGVLVARPDYEGGGRGGRVLAIAGGGVLAVIIAIGAVFVVSGGDDDDGDLAAGPDGESTSTVVPVGGGGGSETPSAEETGVASPSPAASPPSPGATGTAASPDPAESASATPAGSTEGTPRPTSTPGPTETPTVTPTTAPPTATPTRTPSPTQVSTPVPPASSFQYCSGPEDDPDCGDPPYRVICPPTGVDWFIDVAPYRYPSPLPADWRETTALNRNQAFALGANGCQ